MTDASTKADSQLDPTISVVICCYTEHRWRDLVASITSVWRQTEPAEIIVVVDHNAALLERVRALPVRAVPSTAAQRGLSGARNTGVAASSGDIVVFLDDDAVAAPDWLATLKKVYADPAAVGAGGSAEPVWDAGRPGWFPEEFDWVIGCTYRGLPDRRAAVRNLMGCNMSFRREAFDAIGGFNAEVGRVGRKPVGAEETEFCIRLLERLPHRSLVYEPAARVLHRVPADRGTWTYFWSRCVGEGRSKAMIGRTVGARSGLASELRYSVVTLPRAVGRYLLAAAWRRDRDQLRRAGAVIAGLAITTAAYIFERLATRRGRPVQGQADGSS